MLKSLKNLWGTESQKIERLMEETRFNEVVDKTANKALYQQKWDNRFLELAKHVGSWSKDPSTQTGAVIVDEHNRIISMGFNGLPQALTDTTERLNNRELKYKLIVHGEMNALLFAGQSIEGCTLYTWPFASCSTCAKHFIQAGIRRIVAPKTPEHLKERWQEDLDLTSRMLDEAGIDFDLKDFDNGKEKK